MELHHELQPRQVDHYRTKAKKLLRAVRDGDAGAVERAQRAIDDRVRARFVLADALYVVAVEHGHRSWPAFKHDVESQVGATVRSVGRISTASSDAYAAWANRLLADAQRREPVAIERLRARVPRLRDRPAATIAQEATVADAASVSLPSTAFAPGLSWRSLPTALTTPTTAACRRSCHGSGPRRPSRPGMLRPCADCSTSTPAWNPKIPA